MKIDAFEINSIENAIKKLQNYRNNLENELKNHIEELTKKGYEFMLSIIPQDTGELKNSITWEFNGEKGIIKVGATHSIFVEYGTGIVGANSPHPEPQEGWQYDVNSHGMTGWWYFDEKQNRLRWTRGQKANAFVDKTLNFLESKLSKSHNIKLTIINV